MKTYQELMKKGWVSVEEMLDWLEESNKNRAKYDKKKKKETEKTKKREKYNDIIK